MRAERIGDRDTAALAYLAGYPYESAFLAYLLLFDSSPATRNGLFIALDDDDVLHGAAYFGRQVVLMCEDTALDAFANIARDFHGERMILGPRDTVDAYWERIRSWHAPPRLTRNRQLVMALDRSTLKPYERNTTVRHARLDEWTSVADNSARMIAQELDYDPRRSSPEFTANVRTMIGRGLWWVGESLGRLCFFCNIGPWTPYTVQLQGIWTPPGMRRKGLARGSLAAICDRLLENSPTLSLYVNDFNEPAIALYQRVGFVTVSTFATLLF